MTTKFRVTWLRLCGVLAVAAIVFVSLMPPAQWAQLRTGNWLVEHLLGYFAASLIICLGWRRPFVVAGGLMAAAVLLKTK